MKNKIVGIAGTGSAADTHVSSYSELQYVKVKTVFSNSSHRAQDFASKHRIPVYTSFIDDLLDDNEINTIDICNLPANHLGIAQKALTARKDVIIEKPLSSNLYEGEKFFRQFYNCPQAIMVVYQYPYSQTFSKLRDICAQKQYGKVLGYSVHYASCRNPDYYNGWKANYHLAGGGALINQGIHFINLIMGMFAPHSASVYARAANLLHDVPVEDTLIASLHHHDGIIGNFFVSTALPSKMSIEIYTEQVQIKTSGGVVLIEGRNNSVLSTPEKGTYSKLVHDFFSRTQHNPFLKMNLDKGLADLRCIAAMYESVRNNAPVMVSFDDIFLNNSRL